MNNAVVNSCYNYPKVENNVYRLFEQEQGG
nr:MAG TPA: hypothetical protein [Caudoviricetes sp.]